MSQVLSLIALLTLSQPQPEPDATDIDRLFAAVSDPAGPGCAISIVRGSETIVSRTYGQADLEHPAPITLDTIFEAGSVSKQFTAAALAVLAMDERLSLDDDIRRWLPEMPDYGTPITIRMVLTHTSGVRNWDDLAELAGEDRGRVVHSQADAFAMIARQRELNFKPGSEYLYSNSNYVLAALIVERASGQTFEAFSQARLFGPAGMTSTRWRTDHTEIVPGRAEAYTPDDGAALHLDMPFERVVGPGGLLTTVGDLQRWNALMAAPPAEQAAWVRLTNNTRQTLSGGVMIAYGLGLENETVGGQSVVSHAGSTAGYRAYLARAPQTGLSVAVLCNAGVVNTEDLGAEIMSLYLPETHFPAPSGGSAEPVEPSLVGSYRNGLTMQQVVVTADASGLRFNGGAPFVRTEVDLYENAARTRSARIIRDATSGGVTIHLTRIGNVAVDRCCQSNANKSPLRAA